jgi:16S rRNA C1402 (ribose-2'-O) methylase RsmI
MLILLDIDGVMVPANSWKKPEFHDDGFPMFSVKSVHALQKIISETNATVLLTTSHKAKYSLSKWRDIFKSRGISVNGITRLTKNDINSNRKDEILNWYQSKHKPNEHFVIIDDDKLLNGLPNSIKENLVLTSSSVGLTDELADNAISILNHGKFVYA